MLKFLGFLFVVGVTFAIGYQMGREGPDAVMSKARELSSELLSKATALERSTSLRTSLLNAKSHLVQAKLDLLDKNYGRAVSGLEETAKTLNQGKASAEDEIKPRLDALAKKVTDMAAEARALKPGVMTKLNEAVKEVDALLNR
jgi:uncharacterized phage infection (PIP) family protein YhgE